MSIPNIKTQVRAAVEQAVQDAVREALQDALSTLLGKPATPVSKHAQQNAVPMPAVVQARAGAKPPRMGSYLRTVFDAMAEGGPMRVADAAPWLKQLGVPVSTLQQLWKAGYLEAPSVVAAFEQPGSRQMDTVQESTMS